MRIWVYTIAFCEQHFVKFFLNGYKDAEKIIVYDNMSTDDTVKLLRKDKRVEIREYDSKGEIRDDLYIQIKNNCWKEARGKADWVIIVDFDEIFTRAIYPDKFDLDLQEAYDKGFELIIPFGYNIFTEKIENKKYNPFFRGISGCYHSHSEKPCCFRPDKLKEINFLPGCHFAEPVGMDNKPVTAVLKNSQFKLLHYKHTNLDVYIRKNQEYAKRLSEFNRGTGFGNHYLWPMEKHVKIYLEGLVRSKPLFSINETDTLDYLL